MLVPTQKNTSGHSNIRQAFTERTPRAPGALPSAETAVWLVRLDSEHQGWGWSGTAAHLAADAAFS